MEGFEPPHPVLETGGLPLNLHPFPSDSAGTACLFLSQPRALPAIKSGNSWFPRLSFHLAVDGVVPARPAKLLEFQPGSRLFFVLGGCVIPVLAVGTL